MQVFEMLSSDCLSFISSVKTCKVGGMWLKTEVKKVRAKILLKLQRISCLNSAVDVNVNQISKLKPVSE